VRFGSSEPSKKALKSRKLTSWQYICNPLSDGEPFAKLHQTWPTLGLNSRPPAHES